MRIQSTTETTDKYQRISQFKEKIIYTAIRDINKHCVYYVTARDYKEGRKIVGFYFLIESANWHRLKESDPEKAEQMALEAYMKKAQSEL